MRQASNEPVAGAQGGLDEFDAAVVGEEDRLAAGFVDAFSRLGQFDVAGTARSLSQRAGTIQDHVVLGRTVTGDDRNPRLVQQAHRLAVVRQQW